ncbi:MAG: hypothetical protein CMJ19_23040 [Phycisphaeraceae bacterium]|nr:hypothetical protein [Phycisphaeraceae bacterium]
MHIEKQVHFERIGRVEHLQITDCKGLAGVLEIDKAHWIATSAPVSGLRTDPVFLGLVDTDHNDRIRADEITQAIKWVLDHLKDPKGIDEQTCTLRLDAIDTTTDDGEKILTQSQTILAQLGKEDQLTISLEDIRQLKTKIEQSKVSEAGIVLPDATTDETVVKLLTTIILVTGGADHPSGQKGVGSAQLSMFLAEVQKYEAWLNREASARESLACFGDQLPQAYELYRTLAPKFDSYFAQCLALTQDPNLASRFALPAERVQGTNFEDLNSVRSLLRDAPIAKATPDQVYRFDQPTNTVYIKQLKRFADEILTPMQMDTDDVTAKEWQQIHESFKDYDQWVTDKPASAVVTFSIDELLQLSQDHHVQSIRELIDTSLGTAIELNEIRMVEKLSLYQGKMIELVNNFVSFPYLYDGDKRAIFEHGSLVMDGRWFNMAIQTEDRKEHIKATEQSDIFVIYVKVTGINGEPDMELAFPVTSGGKGNLCIGKRGIFHNLKGEMRDAQIVHIVENPISLAEALLSPFKRIASLITGKIEKLTQSAEKNLDKATDDAFKQVQTTSDTPTTENKTAAPTNSSLVSGGVFAAGSVAVAALGSATAYIAQIFAKNGTLKMLGGLLAAVVAVMIPVAIVALLKLMRRDLSSMLEGSGWAINARMRLTRLQADQFTHRPLVPGVIHRWFMSPIFLGTMLVLLVIWLLIFFEVMPSKRTPTLDPSQIQPKILIEKPADSNAK